MKGRLKSKSSTFTARGAIGRNQDLLSNSSHMTRGSPRQLTRWAASNSRYLKVMSIDLPNDILIYILQFLSPVELALLSLACRSLYDLVNDYGWPAYLRSHPRPSQSLSRARAHWSARLCVKYDYLTDEAWHSISFVARPLSHPWQGKSSPLLVASVNRLIVAAGTHIHSFTFGSSSDDPNAPPPVSFEASFSLSSELSHSKDITGITLAYSDGFNDVLFVAFQDGVIERICILASPNGAIPPSITRLPASTIPDNDSVESLSSAFDLLLSLSLNGSVKLANHRDLTSSVGLNWISSVDLKARSWASHLCLSSSTPYAAFGTSNRSAPLPIYHLPYHQFSSPTPSLLLTSGPRSNPLLTSSSAVYGLSQAPPSSPWGSSPQILVAGWYDGKVRCYDLRTPTSSSISFQPFDSPNGTPSSSVTVPTLDPVLSLHNPWSYEPIYSVSCGGGSGSFIAAGAARHSVLSFWDIRSPKGGWSVHAPGNDPSPVYSVILESSRCFGATERRPFVYDFGPGVNIDTYPPIMRMRGDKLKFDKSSGRKGVNYYVTKYPHSRGNIVIDH